MPQPQELLTFSPEADGYFCIDVPQSFGYLLSVNELNFLSARFDADCNALPSPLPSLPLLVTGPPGCPIPRLLSC